MQYIAEHGSVTEGGGRGGNRTVGGGGDRREGGGKLSSEYLVKEGLNVYNRLKIEIRLKGGICINEHIYRVSQKIGWSLYM